MKLNGARMKLIAFITVSCSMFLFASSVLGQETLKPLTPRFSPDPQMYKGVAGGSTALSSLAGTGKIDGSCRGLATANANHELMVQKPFGFLSLKVTAENNVHLLVKGPDGTYCRSGFTPTLEGAWAAGKYEIWVGSPNGERIPYRLSISETSQ
jgi:hypothetical protein